MHNVHTAKVESAMTKEQSRRAIRSAVSLALVSLAISAYSVIAALPLSNLREPAQWAAIILPLAASGLFIFCGGIFWRTQKTIGVYIVIGTLFAVILCQAFFVAGLGVWLGLSGVILSVAISSQSLPQKRANWLIGIGVGIAIATIFIDLYNPWHRLSGGQSLQIFVGVVMGLATLVHIGFMARQFSNYTLRVKLIITYIFLSLIAILILSIINNTVTRNALTKATNNSLQIAAKQTADSIDEFYRSLLSSLQTEASFPEFRYYLVADAQPGSVLESSAIQSINNFQQTTSALGYSILNTAGTILLDTANQDNVTLGLSGIPTDTYTSALKASGYYISPVIFSDSNKPSLFAMMRIDGKDGDFVGILMVRHPASILQEYVTASNNLTGLDSYAILWDENKVRLAHGKNPGEIYKAVTTLDDESISVLQSTNRLPRLPSDELILENASLNNGLERIAAGKANFTANDLLELDQQDTGGLTIIAAASKTTYQPWLVTFAQSKSTALAAIAQQNRITVITAIIILLAVSVLGVFVAQMFTLPINRLTKIAEKITGGDLNAQAVISSQDEIGGLAASFNMMTAQLRQTLAGLEDRVSERTTELAQVSAQMEKRATQLQSVAQVAHSISFYKNPDELFQQITSLISEHFGFYHVGVFLVDKAREYAVLQAANSEGGKRMLARGHRLKVDELSMVGYVSKQGKARVALDVGREAVYFDNPDLPLTRSEISLPLLAGETVIGVLDVQSEQEAAFSDEDIALLSTLADQVSIAIENARLFSDINQTVTELQSVQRAYVQQEWQRITSNQLQSGYQYSDGKITPILKAETPQSASGEEPAVTGLKIPISLRGQQIGVFDLEEIDKERQWSEEEIGLVKTIADQVGLALENARLLEVTQRRAARDRMVADITNKMRRAVDMDTLIQTAVREITNAVDVPEAFVQVGVYTPAQKTESQTSPQQGSGDPDLEAGVGMDTENKS